MNDAAQPVLSPDTGAACLQRAQSLIPLLRSAAAEIDAKCELPAQVLDGMHDAGMFRLLLPRSNNGYELKPLLRFRHRIAHDHVIHPPGIERRHAGQESLDHIYRKVIGPRHPIQIGADIDVSTAYALWVVSIIIQRGPTATGKTDNGR